MKISGQPSNKKYALHHLPTQGQNLFYTFFLILSPILNIAVNVFVFEDFRRISSKGVYQYSLLIYISEISGLVLGSIVALLAVNLIFLLRRHHHVRRSLFLFGIFSTAYLFINLTTVSYGIFAFNVQSLPLLLVSAGIYGSLNIVMLFWYWYFDYPDQVRRLYHPDHFTQLVFPAGRQNHHAGWVPNFLDYLYYTLMMSNTLGPPENHSASGAKAKIIQLIHSTTMLTLLVIFISRAINTMAS